MMSNEEMAYQNGYDDGRADERKYWVDRIIEIFQQKGVKSDVQPTSEE